MEHGCVCLSVFYFLDRLLLLLMVTNEIVFNALFFFSLMVNFEKLMFGLELLVHVNVIITPKVYKSVTFKFARTTVIWCGATNWSKIVFWSEVIAQGSLSTWWQNWVTTFIIIILVSILHLKRVCSCISYCQTSCLWNFELTIIFTHGRFKIKFGDPRAISILGRLLIYWIILR